MAVRSTMAALITRVRGMINDPAGTSQFFPDQDIQDALDFNRVNVKYALLRPTPTLVNNGQSGTSYSYLDYYADIGDWEDDLVLNNGAFQTITPATSDNLTGHWTFNLPAPGQLPPVFITGQYYDRYLASATLLERWAAALSMNFDFTADGQSFRRSQAPQMLMNLAKEYRKHALVHTMQIVRSDLGDDTSATNVTVGNTDLMGW